MSKTSRHLATFLEDRVEEEILTQAESGGEGCIAWLTYREPGGGMSYTTVASGHTEDGVDDDWVANGKELPEPRDVLVVHAPRRTMAVLRGLRSAALAIREAERDHGIDLSEALRHLTEGWADHPEHPDGHKTRKGPRR